MKTILFTLLTLSSLFFVSCKETTPKDETPVELSEDTTAQVQVLEPVKFTYTTEKLADNQYKITFNASVEEGWYVYSSFIEKDGPIPTTIYFDENDALGEIAAVEETGEVIKDGYDEMFDMDIKKFAKSATFSQVVNVTGTTTLTGYLEYMTCDDQQCLFPDPIEFVIEAK